MKKRSVYGVFLDPRPRKVLLVTRGDGWFLPGGTVIPGRSDPEALIDNLTSMLGIGASVGDLMGEPLVRDVHTIVAYECFVCGGSIAPAGDVLHAEFVGQDDLKAGKILLTTGMSAGQYVHLALTRCDTQLSRMGRLVWDALTMMTDGTPKPRSGHENGIFVRDRVELVRRHAGNDSEQVWHRLDPFGPGGLMQPPADAVPRQ